MTSHEADVANERFVDDGVNQFAFIGGAAGKPSNSGTGCLQDFAHRPQ
jgi:hypothetical protein